MKWLAVPALLAAALLAGCTTPEETVEDPIEAVPTPEELAQAAAAAYLEALGPDGDLRSADGDLHVEADGMVLDFSVQTRLYAGDAMQTEILVTDAQTGVPMADEAMEAFSLVAFCTPERVVVQTQGMAAWGGEDIDRETANDGGACLATDEAATAGVQASVARLMGEEGADGGFVGQLASFMDGSVPEYEFVSAEATADGVVAHFIVQEIEVEATIEGGRIVREQASMDMPMDGQGSVAMEMSLEYAYGERSAAPDVRGAETV